MKCSLCGFEETKVLESRLAHEGKHIRRRRACRHCDYRFTTYEKEEIFVFHVKKKSGHLEIYQREKVLRSIQVACQKRPIRPEELDFAVAYLEKQVQDIGERIVTSRQLGDLIMERLHELDLVAYVRFASVYKDFKDTNEFYTTIKSLERLSKGLLTLRPSSPVPKKDLPFSSNI